MPLASAFRTVLHFIGIALIAVMAPLALAQTVANDGFDPNVNGNVFAVAVQPDGKVLVAGDFTTVGAAATAHQGIARFMPDGSFDPTFTATTNGRVSALVLQPNGSILIGGKFTAVNNTTRNHAARLNVDGSLDAFDPNLTGSLTPEVTSIALDATGRIVIGGGFTTVQSSGASVTRNRLARFNSTGSLDAQFDPNFNGLVLAIAIQPSNGDIIVGGGFTSLQPNGGAAQARNRLVRLLTDGTLDAGFIPDANNAVAAIAVQSDGKIIVGGSFTNLGATGLARLKPNGEPDGTFLGGPNGPVSTLAIQGDGSILLGGSFSSVGGGVRSYAARLLPTGVMDNDFKIAPNFVVYSFAIQPDGAVILGGGFTALGGSGATGIPRNHVARVSAMGSIDADFRPDANGRLWTFGIQADGNILAAGSFTSVGGATHHGLVRLSPKGIVDPSFSPDLNGPVACVVEQSNGKILIGGGFTEVNGVSRSFLARLNSDGTLDTSFNSTTNSQVSTIVQQADGAIVVGGAFTQLRPNGTTEPVARLRLARFLIDGSLDLSFNTGVNAPVASLLIQPDKKILVSGSFSSLTPPGVAAVQRFGMARLGTDGSVDATFNPNINGSVRTMALQADGAIVIGGSFRQLAPDGSTGPSIRNNIARLNSDGTLDAAFDPNINSPVSVVSVQAATGNIIVGGTFTGLQPNETDTFQDRNYLVQLTKAGKIDPNFTLNLDVLPGNGVVALAQTSSGSTLVGGAFTSAVKAALGSVAVQRSRLMLIDPTGTVDPTFNADVGSASGAAIEVLSTGVDGRVLAAGSFSGLNGTSSTNLARFYPDSAPDTGFTPVFDGQVHAVAQQLSKGVPVATQRPGLAWLEKNGQLRSTFAPATDIHLGSVMDVAFLPNGQLLVGATLDGVNADSSLVRLNANGTVDSSFAPKVQGLVAVIRIQKSGKILIGGNFTKVGDDARNNIARFNVDGSLDKSFDPNLNGAVTTMELQGDNDQIVIGGAFNLIGATGATTTRTGIARLSADGVVDTTFNPAPNGPVSSLIVLGDNKVIVGGNFTTFTPNGGTTVITRLGIARLGTDGTPDDLDLKPNGSVSGLFLEPNKKIIITGIFSAIAGETHNYIARLTSDGKIDSGFDPNPNGAVNTVVVQASDNSILLGGNFTTVDPGSTSYSHAQATPRSRAVRLLDNGTIDPTFNPNFDAAVGKFFLSPTDGSILASGSFSTIQPSGSIFVGGSFGYINGVAISNLALFSNDGSVSSTFAPNPNAAVYATLPMADGSVIVGGAFTSLAGATRNRLARFSSDGTLDAAFIPNFDGDVDAVAVQADGKLVVGGSFATVGGAGRPNLARLNTDGSLDGTFSPAAPGAVHSIAIQRDGAILYTYVNASGNVLTRVGANGAVDATFTPVAGGTVSTIAINNANQIYIGGTNLGGTAQVFLARLLSTGLLDSAFKSTTNGPVTALSIQPDGKILVGGMFSTLDGHPRFGIGRIGTNTPPADTVTVSADASMVTWSRSGGGPEVYGVIFESSTDFVQWTMLGFGTRVPGTGDWRLSAPALKAGATSIRARGLVANSPGGSTSVVGAQTLVTLASGTVALPPPPVISSATAVSGSAGTSFIYGITASSQPTGYSATGLPAGLSLNTSTGLITGTPTQAGTFTVTLNAINSGGTGTTTLTLIIAASSQPTADVGRLINLSVNAQVTLGNPIIAGFVIRGTAPQNILLRAVGPTLTNYGVTAPLAAPHLRLYNSASPAALLLERDGWDASLSDTFVRLGAFPLTSGSSDAVALVTLPPGAYTFQVSATGSNSGIAVAEIYDASNNPPPADAPRLINLSAREQDHVIAGFVVAGTTSKRVLIRGIGPALAPYGVPNLLADPMVTLYKTDTGVSTAIAANNNWQTPVTLNASYPGATEADITATFTQVGAFTFASGSTDAAILVTLPPGVYTAEVKAQAGTVATGAVMVEVYEAP